MKFSPYFTMELVQKLKITNLQALTLGRIIKMTLYVCVHSPVFLLPLERLDLLEGVGVDVLHLLLLLGLPAGHAVAAGAARPRRAVPGPGRHAAMGHVNIVSLVMVTIMSGYHVLGSHL